jgi:tRNA-dihydrouridine synthase C
MKRTYIQLAPMEGVLDWVLREMLSEVGGLDRMVTEFVRVTDMLLPEHVFYRYCPELEQGGKTLCGTPVFVQLLGGEPGPMAENAARVAELGTPGIDLNFGCPAKTVNRHDGGAALLKAPSRLFDVTSAVRKAVPSGIPVTAKVRLGFDHKEFHLDIARACEDAGAAHVVVHARTKSEMYTPPAHWEYIARMNAGRKIPVVANGEIWSTDDYELCQSQSQVSDVALGRGLVARPRLASEIRRFRGETSGKPCEKTKWSELSASEFRREFLNEFFNRNIRLRGPAFALARMKQILRYWSRDNTESLEWFDEVKRFTDESAVQAFLARLTRVSFV